jgi:hypothetical protein
MYHQNCLNSLKFNDQTPFYQHTYQILDLNLTGDYHKQLEDKLVFVPSFFFWSIRV